LTSPSDPNVIARFPGETSCLTLVWAVLDLYITHATKRHQIHPSNASKASVTAT